MEAALERHYIHTSMYVVGGWKGGIKVLDWRRETWLALHPAPTRAAVVRLT